MTTTAQSTPRLENYFRMQQVPLQWSLILRSLAEVMRQRTGSNTAVLRETFAAVGLRFADDVVDQLGAVQTLEQLTDALNAVWGELNWGMVNLVEEPGSLVIEHCFAPLAEAFGTDQLDWTVGLLEGFYTAAFAQAGGGQGFGARFIRQEEDGLRLIFSYSANP